MKFQAASGETSGNMAFLEGYDPGNSPGYGNHTGDMRLGGVSKIEVGGTTAGNSTSGYDQINVSGNLTFEAGTELLVTPWDDFVPEVGDTFTVVAWGGTASGQANATVTYDSWYANHSIEFQETWGANSLMLTAVPEPATLAALASCGLALASVWWYRRRRPRTIEPRPEPFFEE